MILCEMADGYWHLFFFSRTISVWHRSCQKVFKHLKEATGNDRHDGLQDRGKARRKSFK